MQYLIAIVPPKEISSKVNELRTKWNYHATEPHITLKAPNGLSELNNWIDSVKNVIQNMQPFEITISGINWFNKSVLYYQVQSDRIKDLHFELVKATYQNSETVASDFERDKYIPHVTIMKHKKGYGNLPLESAADKAEQLLQEAYTFTPQFVRIYSRLNSNENFEKFLDVYFIK